MSSTLYGMFRWFEQRRHFTYWGTVAIMAVMSVYMNLSVLSNMSLYNSVEHFAPESSHPVKTSSEEDEENFLGSIETDAATRTLPRRKSRTKPHSTTKEGFGACLLIMDDNHRLSEWIAYHYHVLPLNYLVVGVDPNSETSPTAILDSFRRRHEDLTIVQWNATQIYRGKEDEYRDPRNLWHNEMDLYLQLQGMFVRNCFTHMKQEKKAWVAVFDSDEYIQFNGKEGEISQPDTPDPDGSTHRMVVPGISYPSIQEKGSIYKFLKYLERQPQPAIPSNHPLWNVYTEERRKHGNSTVFVPPCIHIPRLLFGAGESTHQERHKMVPNSLPSSSSSLLSTLRYRKHLKKATAASESINGWAKVMIDVSRIPWEDFPPLQSYWDMGDSSISIHAPVPKHCPPPFFTDGGAASLFRINHYVGSWEAYNYRLDPRASEGRNKSRWEGKGLIQDETDDNIRPWLQGLVEEEGFEQAGEMLLMAGHFTPKEPPLEQEEEIVPPATTDG